MTTLSRRAFLAACPVILVPAAVVGAVSPQPPSPPPSPAPAESAGVGPGFPTQEPDLAREMVAVSHGNLARVKELLARHPTLAKATWDWGFGDWETALGAASHVGHREIAELLLANGAHPTIFSAAMLGQLGTVKAFIAAAPGSQRIKGPHSITLLQHAIHGGAPAQPVVDYLKELGGADETLAEPPLSPEDVAACSGSFVFGTGTDDRIEIAQVNGRLMFTRKGRMSRGMFHRGSLEFSPAGAENARIRFVGAASGPVVLEVLDPDLVLRARKVG